MLRPVKAALLCLVLIFSLTSLYAQPSHCTNLDFELGNFDNWTGYTWIHSNNATLPSTSPEICYLPNYRRQEIMTDTSATDPDTGNQLRLIPPGYKYSARLGAIFYHDGLNKDAQPRCWDQSLRYTMTIDSANALLVLKFAVVLENPQDHSAPEQPRFMLTLYNNKGDTIPDCANYDVNGSNANIKGFNYFQNGNTPIWWRDWTAVGVNLLKYLGQTITVEFMAADCMRGGHGGHAYFVAECHPLYITVQYCRGDSIASLKAPEGMAKYTWTDKNGAVVDTTQSLTLDKTKEGETYTCAMTSYTGCTVQLQSTMAKYELITDFGSSMVDCKSNKVLLKNLSSTNRGKLQYLWNFGNGDYSTDAEPIHTFATSGRHMVSLIVNNPPSTCADTLTKEIESFSPPLVGVTGLTTYCPGLSTWLNAYGAWEYTWSNGSKNDSIEIGDPGGKYWLIGYSSTGCHSDTIYRTVSEEPDWEFKDISNQVLCAGKGPVTLEVTGAETYLWNTKDTTSSIIAASPGIYSVTGTNPRGCKKSLSLNVIEYPLPLTKFEISPSIIDLRHNQITCTIPPETGVTYSWDMGDGTNETGATIHHIYNILGNEKLFTITLTATTAQGCSEIASAIIDVAPFIPNVFTPNGDGINDLFMPGFDLQIIDRNGLLLYRGTTGWDGNYQGRLMDPDTYFYLLHYTDRNNIEHTRKGYITLIR